ncbi:MAG: hypothetical protein H0X51_07430 [Parachlamydiaceae bacterium]|nr:hypothetical protein [Parachlamydiaceae bacterium]
MISVFFVVLAALCAALEMTFKKAWNSDRRAEFFLSYLLLFNLGVMGLIAAYMHVFMGPETARQIGWLPGSPFQFEMGMANLAFGVLGILSYWIRGRFWDATVIGWNILFIGCFVGHLRDYIVNNNTAPWNIGIFIWFSDLFVPLLALVLLWHVCQANKKTIA